MGSKRGGKGSGVLICSVGPALREGSEWTPFEETPTGVLPQARRRKGRLDAA